MNSLVRIMGILNVTPDSFSDGGQFFEHEKAVARALEMIAEGADIIDIGGESSGPGSVDVSLEEELRRVTPVILSLSKDDIILSIDTCKAEVAARAIVAGASIVNDVTALRGDPEMASVVAQTGVQVVLMYSKDFTRPSRSSAKQLMRPKGATFARTTRVEKHYRDVVGAITAFLEERIAYALRAGIRREQIIIDPGMGAFVSVIPNYSFEVLERLAEFKKLGFPILVGTSRKSFLGGKIEERLGPTLAANTIAIKNGADIIRVHDVAAHVKLCASLLSPFSFANNSQRR